MIIDTESPEGRALVALAKFGKWVMDSEYTSKYWCETVWLKLHELGLLHTVQCEEVVTSEVIERADLAKLPEGL